MVSSVNQLSSYFTNIISNLMEIERQPLTRLSTQRDSVNIQRSLYADLKIKLDNLKNATRSLISTSAFYDMKIGRSASITPGITGKTVLTASASSNASAGAYDITDIVLAKPHRLQSGITTTSPTTALNISGDIWLGGQNAPSASAQSTNAVASASADPAEVSSTIAELGSGNYTLETQVIDGERKFRLKDANGNLVSVNNKSANDGSLTSDWQTFTEGETFDTKRGLILTMQSPAPSEDTTTDTIAYTARGRKITIANTDTLVDIANKVNDVRHPVGMEIHASVVGNQLVLSGANTGTDLVYSDLTADSTHTSGALLLSQLQAASPATFKVNGLAFTRNNNTNLTDVIYGVNLNLAPDAEGQTATLTIKRDAATARASIDTFITNFNTLQSYIATKTAITDLGSNTYSRGPLSTDTIFVDLRSDLFAKMMTRLSSGAYRSLSEIGISINTDTLQASVSDASKLENALINNNNDVTTLLDNIIGQIDATLGRFTGTSGYLQTQISSMDTTISELGKDIASMEKRLSEREVALVDQYAEMQSTLQLLSYQQSMWSSIYGSVNRSS